MNSPVGGSNSGSDEQARLTEFQLILKQRKINDLLVFYSPYQKNHVPHTINVLIRNLSNETENNKEEIALLRAVVSSSGTPEGQRYFN